MRRLSCRFVATVRPFARSPLLPYAEELEPLQRRALRTASFVGALLILAFSALDRALVPHAWLVLLCVRSAASLLLFGIAWRLRRESSRFDPAVALAVFALGAALCAGTLVTGGVHSAYPYAALLVILGAPILLPLRARQATWIAAEMTAITLLPLLPLASTREDHLALATRASFLLCGSLLGIGGASVNDGLRRREHLARAEFARHVGLVNLGTLAGGLAHELSNPLAALTVLLDMLDLELPATHRDLIVEAQGSVARMRAVIDAMRRGARFSDDELREVELPLEIEQSLVLLRGRLERKVQVVRDYGDLPKVRCQPTLIGQVLVNLVVNAADAMQGRTDARIAVRTVQTDGHAVIEVEDNGPGVPADQREKIFEPFVSTKGASGNGLGLWISAEIARRHGGSLTVHPANGGGALFRLALPLRAHRPDLPGRSAVAAAVAH
jgi:signal transduction histidine kinase